MTTKEMILQLLEEHRGVYFSGEEIAKKLSVSRSAVWKAVKNLESEGYEISAATNKGYCLSESTDIISFQGIQKYLNDDLKKLDITVKQSVTSTNTLLKERANEGAGEGCMMIANEQTKGRGRVGHSFYSPDGTGVYMSLLLRPEMFSEGQAVRITTIAAVAVCEAVEAVSEEKAEIKWVNDIFVRGKKVCGILTEGSFDMESGKLDYAVLGTGINVYEPEGGFPGDIDHIAGAVFTEQQRDVKNRLIAEFLNRFFYYYRKEDYTEYVTAYRSRSMVIGKEVSCILGESRRDAKVLDIDDECHLIVQYGDGSVDSYSSGEISVKV